MAKNKSITFSVATYPNSLFQIALVLLHPLHPLLDLQVDIRFIKMVPNDLPWPKTCLAPNLGIYSLKWFWTSYIPFLTFRSTWGLWKWFQMLSHSPKHVPWHQNDVSSLTRRKVTDLVILRSMIFPKYFLTPPKNHEIGKNSKNGVHFILSVFKVVRVKVLSFLLFFAYFILFWGGSKCAHFFFTKFFENASKKSWNRQKLTKMTALLL